MNKPFAIALLGCAAVLTAGCLRIVVHGDPTLAAERMPETVVRAFKAAMPPVRIATYNVSLHGNAAGELVKRLEKDDLNARRIAAVIQNVRPDIVLLNEFDYDAEGRAADLFQRRYLEQPQFGEKAIHYPYRYLASVNTGVASGFDLDRDGSIGKSGRAYGNDAWGFGLYPGQYGMLLLSRYPIDAARIRSFKHLKWSTMPDAKAPVITATGQPWFATAAWQKMPVSSKSHWDVPVQTPQGEIHVLASHPTPPSFDGPENRNGLRNKAELDLWNAYLSAPDARWLCDDGGQCGGLKPQESFVILGDLNADPQDGDGEHAGIANLIAHPRVAKYAAPESDGGANTARKYARTRAGNVRTHTADFGPTVGTLRVDYVLPSADFDVLRSGVFWPVAPNPKSQWVGASDHHMVWLDIRTPPPK